MSNTNPTDNEYDSRHPHERDGRGLAPLLAADGSCWICRLDVMTKQRDVADREATRLRAALDELDHLNPADFKRGQSHLTPAFREIDFREVFRRVCRIVNGVLHGTDENGRAVSEEAT